jgi:hypothetical protein
MLMLETPKKEGNYGAATSKGPLGSMQKPPQIKIPKIQLPVKPDFAKIAEEKAKEHFPYKTQELRGLFLLYEKSCNIARARSFFDKKEFPPSLSLPPLRFNYDHVATDNGTEAFREKMEEAKEAAKQATEIYKNLIVTNMGEYHAAAESAADYNYAMELNKYPTEFHGIINKMVEESQFGKNKNQPEKEPCGSNSKNELFETEQGEEELGSGQPGENNAYKRHWDGTVVPSGRGENRGTRGNRGHPPRRPRAFTRRGFRGYQ